ncbi:PLC-like phosphodiesterase [Gigaspora margarita]|uniref:Phosphoinositide phospholipase C n=1 Tax=Gigaspora margarita TaxID=4874 RepID=A0A8H4AIQ6_GIGMA|nr:PLC-like phosphodiesterase [Gigaspora margarita]
MDQIYHNKQNVIIEPCLAEGTALLKVSLDKKQEKIFRIDIDQGQVLWNSKKSGKINIENIKEIRVGDAIRGYKEPFKISADIEPRWFTIIYVDSGKYKTLHLIAPTLELFNIWVDNLKNLYLHSIDMIGGLDQLRKRDSLWLNRYWKQADKDGKSKLGYDDVEADVNKNGSLDFTDFQQFVKLIKKRDELDKLFNSLAKERGNILTLQEFKGFLVGVQKCTLKEEEYDNLYHKFWDNDLKGMNLEGFSCFLMSSDNTIFASEHAKVYQDMSQPLSHYFIDSSHNTYLLGNQLAGKSSVEGYIRAIREGARCVEIDCWDGPDGPVVFHGHTLTTKIKFQDVISSIRTHAFKSSPYPLIVSLEVHCSIEQQNQIASILLDTLGDCLVTKFLSENETELPSPENLSYKIILKGHNTTIDASDVETSKEKKAEKKKIAKALSDLIVYCASVKFEGFDRECFYRPYEKKSDKDALIQHNTCHLTRIYPMGVRVNSSNYEPHHQWIAGNQLVALNSQIFDRGMQISQAMFSVNGGCGYVLKPERLCNPKISNKNPPAQTLTIEIISAQQLPKTKNSSKREIVDPFVEVELLIPGAEATKKRTKTISDNGFNPTWNETLKFTLNCEEIDLVFLRFVVWDKDLISSNDLIASYCILVSRLQFGYRYVPLNDVTGELYPFASLFIRSSLE